MKNKNYERFILVGSFCLFMAAILIFTSSYSFNTTKCDISIWNNKDNVSRVRFNLTRDRCQILALNCKEKTKGLCSWNEYKNSCECLVEKP